MRHQCLLPYASLRLLMVCHGVSWCVMVCHASLRLLMPLALVPFFVPTRCGAHCAAHARLWRDVTAGRTSRAGYDFDHEV